MRTKQLLISSLCLIIASVSSLSAETVGDNFKVGQLYYQVIKLFPKEVAVVPQNIIYPYWVSSEKPTGDLSIPSTITYRGTKYTVTSIGANAFYECTGLSSITMPHSITNIEKSAFYDCSSLSFINIPNSVTRIGKGAFSNCSKLAKVTIPNSVKTIDNMVFYWCSSLTTIQIPNSVTKIGEDAFAVCEKLSAIKVAPTNPNYCDIEGVLFNKKKNTLIQFPVSKPTDTYAIPSSVTTIGAGAFSDCSDLTYINIPNSVTMIGRLAFYGCKRLTTITIPNTITKIEKLAFYGCNGLTSIASKITNLNHIVLGDKVFDGIPTAICTLYVPKGTVATYQTSQQWNAFANIKEIESTHIILITQEEND